MPAYITMYHASPRENREQIEASGLLAKDPDMCGQEAGVYLWPTLDDAREFPCARATDWDIYQVEVKADELFEDEGWGCGAAFTPLTVPASRLKLAATCSVCPKTGQVLAS